MAKQSITIRTVEVSRPCPGRDVYNWDSGLRGFGLRVTPKGVKSYVLQYRVNGGPARRTTIGIHGSPWTPQTARKEAERLLMLVRQGVDPVEQARNAKRRERMLNFSSYCDQFVELYLQSNWPDTWPEQRRILENVLKPRWGKKALTALKRADMVMLMDDYADCWDNLEGGGEPFRQHKLFLLGNGTVGKTQVALALIGEPYDDTNASTHGIQLLSQTVLERHVRDVAGIDHVCFRCHSSDAFCDLDA